jgi:cell division septation protein DedD
LDLAIYIEELLYTNDCVILPTIGGFIVNPTTASIDFVEQQLIPPSKPVSFNPKLVNNDGLLAHYISQKQHISYNQAQSHLETYTRQIESSLFDNQIVNFENIGKLYFNSDSKLEFVPNATNFLRSAYGLPTISCTPILRSKDYLQQPKTAQATPVRRKARKVVWLTPVRLSIAAAVLLFLFSIPLWSDVFFSPEADAVETLAEAPSSETPANQVVSASILPSNPITMPTENDASTAAIKEQTAPDAEVVPPTVAATVDPDAEDFIIVLGAFSKEKNAYRLADKLEKDNYLPDVTVKNGLNRVGVQLTCTPSELAEHLKFIQKNYNKKAWVVE